MYSFRCRACGHLVTSAHTGERTHPRACPVCKAGVAWNAGQATDQPDNWEVLADATPERLAELGLTEADVQVHTPTPKEHSVRAAVAICKEGLEHIAAKRAHWAANRDAIAAEFAKLDAQYTDLGRQLNATEDHAALARLTDERERVYQRMHTLANLEPTKRDEEHEAHLKEWQGKHEAYLAGQSGAAQLRTLVVGARDGVKTSDRG